MQGPISDQGVRSTSTQLEGKQLALAICGGIASVEVVKIIRELRRRGASVQPYMSPSAEKFITPLSVGWAADKEAVRDSSEGANHLAQFDLVVVAPLTLNTLSKAAQGVCDNVVTLLIAAQLGRSLPVMMVPTMNDALWKHPMTSQHCGRLKEWGVRFFDSPHEEDRLKMPAPEKLADFAVEVLG